MSELFNRCIKVVLENEGGYVFDKDDPGGETKYGISKRAFPDLDIKNLTVEQAKDIYYEKYWIPLNLEGIIEPNNALQIFDFGVNAGLGRAIRTAQRLVRVHVDGVIGPNTISAINETGCFTDRYKHARREYYEYLVKLKPNLKKFLKGWLNRIEHTKLIEP